MSDPKSRADSPQVRLIYLRGILTAIEKQMRYLEIDRANAQAELDRAKAELKEAGAYRTETDPQN
jgi:hypothetical protein